MRNTHTPGRTERMLRAAINIAQQGREVIVVMWRITEMDYCLELMRLAGMHHGMTVKRAEHAIVWTAAPRARLQFFSPLDLGLHAGVAMGTPVFIDHMVERLERPRTFDAMHSYLRTRHADVQAVA